MREIKFRAYEKDGNKVISLQGIHWNKKGIEMLISETGGQLSTLYWGVEQYTGLKDKNGKEIYEGDIVLLNKQVYCRVVYEQNTCAFMLIMLPDRFYNPSLSITNEKTQYIEVIGNIHENADLLKEETK